MAALWLFTPLGEDLTLSRSSQRAAAGIRKTPAGHQEVREAAPAASGVASAPGAQTRFSWGRRKRRGA